MTAEPPQCLDCKHLDPQSNASHPRCKAFPEGIPVEVWLGSMPHTKPLPGDHGIQFEAKEGAL